jgi:formiminotetrahydrofolate cyclodeaminase
MFVAAAGAALIAMVARISAANPKFTSQKEAAERIVERADALRAVFISARERDEAAFEAVVQAQRLPKNNDAEKAARTAALEKALHHAADVPLALAAQALDALHVAIQTLEIENKNLISDVACAAEFFHAALKSCTYNVRINHHYMKDQGAITAQMQEVRRLEHEGQEQLRRIRSALNSALA